MVQPLSAPLPALTAGEVCFGTRQLADLPAVPSSAKPGTRCSQPEALYTPPAASESTLPPPLSLSLGHWRLASRTLPHIRRASLCRPLQQLLRSAHAGRCGGRRATSQPCDQQHGAGGQGESVRGSAGRDVHKGGSHWRARHRRSAGGAQGGGVQAQVVCPSTAPPCAAPLQKAWERIAAVPKEGDPPPDGLSRWPGAWLHPPEHPQLPRRAGTW